MIVTETTCSELKVKSEKERLFEEVFGVQLPEGYEAELSSKGLNLSFAKAKEEELVQYEVYSHCGTSTSSTLSMEFFVAISEEMWEDVSIMSV